MRPRSAASTADSPPRRYRLRLEMIVASIVLALGLFALPALIYLVGSSMLGAYGNNAGIGTFYGDFYADLASGAVRAWALAIGPLVVFFLVRLLFLKRGDDDAPDTDPDVATPQAPRRPVVSDRRVEPRVSLE